MGDEKEGPLRNFATEMKELDVDHGDWIFYTVGEQEEELSSWLQRNSPSVLTNKYDGIAWIAIHKSGDKDSTDSHYRDVDGLLDSWEKLQQSGRPINIQTITELAKTHNVTTGKWLFHCDTGIKVDHLWSLVANGIASGALMSNSAKVSSYTPDKGEKHVVCIYNKDFTDFEDVEQLEHGIRSIGIKCGLSYKPDVYTCLKIYRSNQWGLRPTIYESVFNIGTGLSKISKRENNMIQKLSASSTPGES